MHLRTPISPLVALSIQEQGAPAPVHILLLFLLNLSTALVTAVHILPETRQIF